MFAVKVDITILLTGTEPTNLLDSSGILSSTIDAGVTGGLSFSITSSTSALVASAGEESPHRPTCAVFSHSSHKSSALMADHSWCDMLETVKL